MYDVVVYAYKQDCFSLIRIYLTARISLGLNSSIEAQKSVSTNGLFFSDIVYCVRELPT